VKPLKRASEASEVSQCMAVHIDEIRGDWGEEHKFHPERRWKFDFVITGPKIAIEIEGGIWVKGGGGHNRGKAFLDDMEKYNHAVLLGWKVLRFSPQQVLDGTAIAFIKKCLAS
jgi:very-short-patch-repair endonuclease